MIKNTGEICLLYNLDGDKGRRLRFLMVRMGMRIRVVSKDQYGLAVGTLAGMKEVVLKETGCSTEDFQDEMLIMHGLTNKRLDLFLKMMRQEKIGRINYKAMLTQTNAQWNSFQLYDELKKEHEAMNGL